MIPNIHLDRIWLERRFCTYLGLLQTKTAFGVERLDLWRAIVHPFATGQCRRDGGGRNVTLLRSWSHSRLSPNMSAPWKNDQTRWTRESTS